METIAYYNRHATDYFEESVYIDMQETQERFMELLTEGASVLDLGCGSGRDSAVFMSRGFDVTAMDGSEELCELASIHIGQGVLNLSFEQLDFEEVFDGVWASASLLHIPGEEIGTIMDKIIRSMKSKGILYMSFQYGDFEGIRDERYYKDYRTKALKDLIAGFDALELIDIRKSEDTRTDKDIFWIDAFVRKI